MIGRDPANAQVVVADDEVSRQHAWVGLNEQGKWWFATNFRNGTFAENARIQEKVLRPHRRVLPRKPVGGTFPCKNYSTVASAPSPAPAPAAPAIGVTAPVAVKKPKPGVVQGGTSVISAAEIAAAQQQEKSVGGTVASS